MKVSTISFLTIAFATLTREFSFGQLNMTLQDSMDYNVGVNDVSGYAAPDGREYALVGINTGVSIVDIDSATIKEVVFVPGVNNLWRDINIFGHYAYVTSEARVGLLIIDLSFLPDSVQTHIWSGDLPTPSGTIPFEKAHTIFIDEFGIAYLNGSNVNSGGVVLVDITTNPIEPIFLGYGPPIYSHDVYARDSILYSAEIYSGDVSIYDIHNPSDVTLLGRVKTPNEFPHNAWLSDDSAIMFTTDERSNSYVTAYDITNPGDIRETDRYRQAAVDGSGAIVHNVYVLNNWLILAYYTSGTVIVDGSRPGNLVEVGNFDSFLGLNGGFSGVWGAYPFLPSGKILASDRNNGLFVFNPAYIRAAFLEGIVIDSITGAPISGAVVSIMSDEIVLPQTTILDGTFKTGKAIPGTFPINVIKEGYHPKTIVANFINGELLTPVFELSALSTYVFSGRVINEQNEGVPFAKVVIFGQEGIYEITSDADGNFLIPAVYEGIYEIQAGVWGQTVETEILMDGPKDISLIVEPGYRDDFDADLGWTVSGQVTQGQWARGIPTRQTLFNIYECGSGTDSPFDQGAFAYSTGISTSGDVISDEVSGGTTSLVSPAMDLEFMTVANISFDFWLCEFPPNQYEGFNASFTNGVDTFLLAEFSNDTTNGSWQNFSADIVLEEPKFDYRIMFSAMDTTSGPGEYYLKAHVDNFNLVAGATSVKDELASAKHFLIYPNPVDGSTIYLKPENGIEGEELSLKISDVRGRIISTYRISKTEVEKGIHPLLDDGIYFMQWNTDKGEYGVEKIIVLK